MCENKKSIALFCPNKWAHLLKSNNINGEGSSSKSKKKKKTTRKVKVSSVSQENVIHSFEEESLEDNNRFIYQRMIPVTILQVVL
jgi:hypothetical protein